MPSNGATYVSTWKHWADLKKTADKFRLVFIPTVGPGFDDNSKQLKINSNAKFKHRINGQYYNVAWRAALKIGAEFIGINSFNDWQCGTQIEEAIPKNGFKDYNPSNSSKYLDLTRYWVSEFIEYWNNESSKRAVESSKYLNNTVC